MAVGGTQGTRSEAGTAVAGTAHSGGIKVFVEEAHKYKPQWCCRSVRTGRESGEQRGRVIWDDAP